MGKYKRKKKPDGTARGVEGSAAETGNSAQNVVTTGQSVTIEFEVEDVPLGVMAAMIGWTEEDLAGRVKDNARARALLSGNHLAEEVMRASEDWLVIVYLHWSVCVMCGQLHHSYMMHILDDDGKVVCISPMEYERMKHE